MNIGENIKKYRKMRGLTQIELAKILESSPGTISQYEKNIRTPSLSRMSMARYEQGKTEPQLSTIEAIAQALEVTVPELIGYPAQQIIYKDTPISELSTEVLLSEIERRLNR